MDMRDRRQNRRRASGSVSQTLSCSQTTSLDLQQEPQGRRKTRIWASNVKDEVPDNASGSDGEEEDDPEGHEVGRRKKRVRGSNVKDEVLDNASGSDEGEEDDPEDHVVKGNAKSSRRRRRLRYPCSASSSRTQFEKCALEVSDEFIICGFYDGGSSNLQQTDDEDDPTANFNDTQSGEANSTRILVTINCNSSSARPFQPQAVSLDPQKVAEILGLESEGLTVPSCPEELEQLLESVSLDAETAADIESWRCRNGYNNTCFPPDIREHVERRQKELYLPVGTSGNMTACRAFCLSLEFLKGTRFNWAKDWANFTAGAVRTCLRSPEQELSSFTRALLSKFIAEALPSLADGRGVHNDVPAQQQQRCQARRRRRKVSPPSESISKRKRSESCQASPSERKKKKSHGGGYGQQQAAAADSGLGPCGFQQDGKTCQEAVQQDPEENALPRDSKQDPVTAARAAAAAAAAGSCRHDQPPSGNNINPPSHADDNTDRSTLRALKDRVVLKAMDYILELAKLTTK